MTLASPYRIEVAACPVNPAYYRWTVHRGSERLALPGYAYASAWSAREAAQVALHWHLILAPYRAQSSMDGCPTLAAADDARRDAA